MADTTNAKRRRRRGEGSTYQSKKDQRWHAAIVWTDPVTGNRKRHVVSGQTEAIARERMDKLRTELDRSGRPTSRTTVAEYLGPWLASERGRIRESTWRGCELHVRSYIVPAIGQLALAELRPSDVERMTSGLVASGLSGVSARSARGTLRRALTDAERDGLVSRNVARLSRPPRVDKHEFVVLTADETRRFLDATADDEYGPLYAIAATTGLRQGEVLGLAWSDVVGLDGASPTLAVRHALGRAEHGWALTKPKTQRSRRTLELGATSAQALRRQRTCQKGARLAAGELWRNDHDLVFTDPIGRPDSGRRVTKVFSARLAKLGLPHVRFHDLRHGVASLLLAQGVPLKIVSETLGHSTIAITADTYSHLDREQRRQSADAVERALGSDR